eukprot:6161641-Pyramimonas_sp.AAC.1
MITRVDDTGVLTIWAQRAPRPGVRAGAQPLLREVLCLHRGLDGAHLDGRSQDAHHAHQVPQQLPHGRAVEPHPAGRVHDHQGFGDSALPQAVCAPHVLLHNTPPRL